MDAFRSRCDSSLGARGCWQIAATTRTGIRASVTEQDAWANFAPERNRKKLDLFQPLPLPRPNLVGRFFKMRSSSVGAALPEYFLFLKGGLGKLFL